MQRMVKNVVRVKFRFKDSDEVNTIDVVAKSHALAYGEILDRYGSDVIFVSIEDLGPRIAVLADEVFYSIATFKEPKNVFTEEEN